VYVRSPLITRAFQSSHTSLPGSARFRQAISRWALRAWHIADTLKARAGHDIDDAAQSAFHKMVVSQGRLSG